MTNKLQPFPCKVPRKFIVVPGDYLIILVLHETFMNHGCLMVAWIN